MTEQEEKDKQDVHADNNSVAVGSISVGGDVSGNITIGNTVGYTVDDVSALITQIASTFQAKPFDGRCPYKGLDVFEEDDAELFFGREKLGCKDPNGFLGYHSPCRRRKTLLPGLTKISERNL